MNIEDILWLIFEIGINLFQGFMITWFWDHVLTKKDSAPRLSFLICFLALAICLSTYLFFPMPSNDTWIIIVPLLYVLICFKNSIWLKIYWVAISFLSLIGTSYFMIWCMKAIFNIELAVLATNSFARIIYVLTGNLFTFLLFLIIPKAIKSRLEDFLPLTLFAAIMILLLLIGDAQYAVFYSAESSAFWSQFSGALVLVVTVLTIILYQIMTKYAQDAATKKQLEMQIQQERQHIDELNQVSESLHTLRHDLLNHLHIASDLMKQGKTAEGSQYLNDIESHVLHIFSTGCSALDSALYIKQLEMQQRGIVFHAVIEPLTVLPITTYDLCTIVSNLLDNAMDAYGRFPEPPEKYTVMLSIHRHADMLYIESINPVWEPSLRMENDRYLTSKSDVSHGKGIPAIERIMDRFNAYHDFSAKDGCFKVLLALPYLDEIDVNMPHEEAVRKGFAAIQKRMRRSKWPFKFVRRIR